MSATFRLQAKKKFSQNDLRRMMNEHRAARTSDSATKIDSPLAKYNESGQLICILCQTVVRSEAVWKVHINSKAHKENIANAKALKEKAQKRPATPPPVPAKKLKSILKNSNKKSDDEEETTKSGGLPEDFFDAQPGNSIIKRDLVKISRDQPKPAPESEATEMLPEGFFDDPRQDAKARNTEYKDPNDEEWEKFQKEIKEATSIATQIINEEQEEATAERQIEEIDEQINIWSRVLEIEKKKEKAVEKLKAHPEQMDHDGNSEDSEADDEGDLDEYLDWRAKKSYK